MFKLIKYEIIGKYKALGILSIIIIILNLLLLTRWNSWGKGPVIALSIMISTVATVVLFIWCIGIFSHDVYDDKGYLTFTIPQSGYSILGSKLIVSLIFSIIISIVSGIFIYGFTINAVDISKELDTAGVKINIITSVLFVVSMYAESILGLLEIYFAITITRLAIFRKKLGKFIAFVAFIIEMVILGFVNWGLGKIFPQELHVKIFNGVSGSIANFSGSGTDIVTNGISIEIVRDLVFPIVLFIGLFIATSYMIEKKIDL